MTLLAVCPYRTFPMAGLPDVVKRMCLVRLVTIPSVTTHLTLNEITLAKGPRLWFKTLLSAIQMRHTMHFLFLYIIYCFKLNLD